MPRRSHRIGQDVRIRKAPATTAIQPDKIGIAEPAHRARAVPLQPGPEIASGKPAEHRRPSGLHPLALQVRKISLTA